MRFMFGHGSYLGYIWAYCLRNIARNADRGERARLSKGAQHILPDLLTGMYRATYTGQRTLLLATRTSRIICAKGQSGINCFLHSARNLPVSKRTFWQSNIIPPRLYIVVNDALKEVGRDIWHRALNDIGQQHCFLRGCPWRKEQI